MPDLNWELWRLRQSDEVARHLRREAALAARASMKERVLGLALRAWLWSIIHHCCFCRLGPLGTRVCLWIDKHAWTDVWNERNQERTE